jgi:hypothetical protein
VSCSPFCVNTAHPNRRRCYLSRPSLPSLCVVLPDQAGENRGGAVRSAPDLSPVVTMIIAVAPIVAPRVVAVGGVATTVVVRPPPAPIGTANPTYLLHTRNRVGRDWCDWHCRCGGRCKAATKCSGRKNQFDFGHGHSSEDAPLTRDIAGSFWPDWVN